MKYIFLLFTFLSFSQQYKNVDFTSLQAEVSPNFENKSIAGKVNFKFKVKNVLDTIKIDAKNMIFNEVKLNGKLVKFMPTQKHLLLFEGFKLGNNQLSFIYSAQPKQTLYFTGEAENQQIFTQGQGKYTSHWLPSFDEVNEKLIFNITVHYNKNFQVLSNGLLKKQGYLTNKYDKFWQYTMQKTMSSYLVMLAIGKFAKQQMQSKNNTVLELYLDKKDSLKMEPTFRNSKLIFDYLEQEIGVKYPWQIYRQVAVRDFLYAGMENTSATIFSQEFVVDSIGFNDKNYINVNAHELAHQWFGDLITAQNGNHHWLQEGFATYYALLAERKVFGEDYFYNQLYNYAKELNYATKTDQIPLQNEKASSLTFYRKGAWALHTIREEIGAENFRKAVKNYLKKHQFRNVITSDFLNEIKKISPNFDIENFQKTWLNSTTFDFEFAKKILAKNETLAQIFSLNQQIISYEDQKNILESNAYQTVKIGVIENIKNLNYADNSELLKTAMKDNLYVRQAVAENISVINIDFKSSYETLLNDASYKTNEMALVNLWKNFPLERKKYLEQTKNISGNNDKSFRCIWLYLALNTPGYNATEQEMFLNELLEYTSAKYESAARQNAFEVLLKKQALNPKVMIALYSASTHHKWQFAKFVRDQIRFNMDNQLFIDATQELYETANEQMKPIYKRFLDEVNTPKK